MQRVDLIMDCWLFKDIHFVESETLKTVADDPLKFDNEINAFIINANVVLCYFFFSKYLSLSIISLTSVVL